MSTVLSAVALVLVLVVLVWVAVFGGLGVVIADLRGQTRMHGFLLGALLGPVGWLILFLLSLRRSRPGRVAPKPSTPQPPSSQAADEAYY